VGRSEVLPPGRLKFSMNKETSKTEISNWRTLKRAFSSIKRQFHKIIPVIYPTLTINPTLAYATDKSERFS